MKKALKTTGKIILAILILLILFLTGLFVYNRIMLGKEAEILSHPPGQMVEIDGNNMCVYTEGEGEHTLVFMSGWGVASPILDFRRRGRTYHSVPFGQRHTVTDIRFQEPLQQTH